MRNAPSCLAKLKASSKIVAFDSSLSAVDRLRCSLWRVGFEAKATMKRAIPACMRRLATGRADIKFAALRIPGLRGDGSDFESPD